MDRHEEYQELLALYKKHLELNEALGVEFVPRSARPNPARPAAAAKPAFQRSAPRQPPEKKQQFQKPKYQFKRQPLSQQDVPAARRSPESDVPSLNRKPSANNTPMFQRQKPAPAEGGGGQQSVPQQNSNRTQPPQQSPRPDFRRRPQQPPEVQLPDNIPPAPEISANDIFAELRAEVKDCQKCELCNNRTCTVFGEGDSTSDLVFVGEGPGADEDRLGRPFVGRAGRMLTKIIHDGMKLHRHQVFIANIVKCRPPGNRAPTIGEMTGCRPYLLEQLRTIKPKVVVALGATAVHGLLGEKVAITKFRGTFRDWEGSKLMPTFHPSYLMRNYTPDARRAVWEDMKKVMQYLKKIDSPLMEGR